MAKIFHPEGYPTIILSLFISIPLTAISIYFLHSHILFLIPIILILFVFQFLIFYFFRYPNRKISSTSPHIISPCDGKTVVIETITETEYFKDKRIQISVFMSPLNVHINWYPISGTVVYQRHHHGKYLVAWHPKSSTENERTTVVIKTDEGCEILVRQIAGKLARRIVCYAKEGQICKQGDEMGFIKFGSRLDVILPVDTEIVTTLNQIMKGNFSIISK